MWLDPPSLGLIRHVPPSRISPPTMTWPQPPPLAFSVPQPMLFLRTKLFQSDILSACPLVYSRSAPRRKGWWPLVFSFSIPCAQNTVWHRVSTQRTPTERRPDVSLQEAYLIFAVCTGLKRNSLDPSNQCHLVYIWKELWASILESDQPSSLSF